jgi:crossover junction endodeoxyribonuclease RusA
MLRLVLPYPISANRYWGTRVVLLKATGKWAAMTYVTKEAEAYRVEVAKLCVDGGIKEPFTGRVEIGLQLFPHRPLDFKTRMRKLGEAWDDDVRCIDLDNANKVVLDALKSVAIEDDRWVRSLQSERMEPDAKGARVVVYIRQLQLQVAQQSLIEETQ